MPKMSAPITVCAKLLLCQIKQPWKQLRKLSLSGNPSVKEILSQPELRGQKISAKGWVKAVRAMKEGKFVDLGDGSSQQILQVVVTPCCDKRDITFGSCLEVTGLLEQSKGQGQAVELVAESISLVGPCDVSGDYPFKPRKRYSADYSRQHLHLRQRTNSFAALLRMRNVATQEIHRFYQSLGFIQVHTPVLTSNDCEGAGEVFHIMPGIQASGPRKNTPDTTDNSTPLMFFDTPACLTVSGQLHLEAVASGMSKVYAFNTAFRAENCQSRRHMSEFYMVEAELAFLSSLDDLMQNVEDLVKTTVKRMLETCESDLTLFFQHLSPKGHKEQVQKMLSSEFKRMTYTDAIGILRGQPGLKSKAEWGDDLSNEQEQCLVKQAGGLPVFVTDWPASAKPFYMRPNPDGKTVACFDLLVPDVGELCGGSLREDDLDRLEAKVAKLGQADALSWYVDLRRYGATPTGGYGLGFERHLQWILGINNIKDTIPFPRWTHHCRM